MLEVQQVNDPPKVIAPSEMNTVEKAWINIGQSIVNTWIKSDGHRKLLLHKSMRYGSVSTSLVSREKKYYSDVVGNCFVTFNAFR